MKRYLVIFFTVMAVVFAGCVKDLGIPTTTILKGRVIKELGQPPVSGVNVSITNGQDVYASCTTGEDGLFTIKVSFDEIDDDYYLQITGQGMANGYEIRGMGKEQYDYKDVILHVVLVTFQYQGITYDVYPSDIHDKTWEEASNYCKHLHWAGKNDWCLPDCNTLRDMYFHRGDIGGFGSYNYWCAERCKYVNFNTGSSSSGYDSFLCSFRPVRIHN